MRCSDDRRPEPGPRLIALDVIPHQIRLAVPPEADIADGIEIAAGYGQRHVAGVPPLLGSTPWISGNGWITVVLVLPALPSWPPGVPKPPLASTDPEKELKSVLTRTRPPPPRAHRFPPRFRIGRNETSPIKGVAV